MKDLILGFKLLRYGYKLKTNVMMLILFTAIGFVTELSSHGTNILGGFYFMLTGMFAYQMIIYMNASGLCAVKRDEEKTGGGKCQ